jgi:uncharacterized protein YecA (UPF0149 family)
MAYAQPLLDKTDGSIEQVNKALELSQACWNLAIIPEEERRSAIDDMRLSLNMSQSEIDDFESSVLTPMILRHQAMFPGLHQRHLFESPDRMDVLPQEDVAPPDRYAPCPCNSGKKYKFCCGRPQSVRRAR